MTAHLQRLCDAAAFGATGAVLGTDGVCWWAELARVPLFSVAVCDQRTAVCLGDKEGHPVFFDLDPGGPPRPGSPVHVVAAAPLVHSGPDLLGTVVDVLGRPLDGRRPGRTSTAVLQPPLPVLDRPPVARRFTTGIRAIDGCLPLGVGQRIGLFAGPGQGKSTLLGQLAAQADAPVCVVALVGERSREITHFTEVILPPSGRSRTVCVAAPANAPPAARALAALSASAVAEWFRDQGADVLFLVDSLTRMVRATAEIDDALRRVSANTPASISHAWSLAALVERAGTAPRGAITGVYTVLTETQDDPVGPAAQAVLDGHIALSASLAAARHFPAIDLPKSVSRLAPTVAASRELQAATAVIRAVAAYREHADLLHMGAYQAGTSPYTDAYLAHRDDLDAFLRQAPDERSSWEDTRSRLYTLGDAIEKAAASAGTGHVDPPGASL